MLANNHRHALATGGWLSGLRPDLRHAILQEGRSHSLAAGEVLFAQGNAPSGLHGIARGQAQVTGVTSSGVEVLIALLRIGEWTGFLACVDSLPYAFTVSATEPTDVFTLPLASVRRLFHGDLEAFQTLVRPELAASRRVYEFLIENVTLTPLQRLARRLLELTSEAYGGRRSSDFIAGVSQDQIAVSIMTSRQWTNHLLGQLAEAGIIVISRAQIEIRDRQRLNALAHGAEADRFGGP